MTSTVDQGEEIIDKKWNINYTKNGENFENESAICNGVKVLTARCGTSQDLNKTRLLFHVNKLAKKGDVLKLSFFIRPLKKDSIYGIIETNIDDQKLLTQLSDEWQHVQIPVKLSKDIHDYKGRIAISLGGQDHHFKLAKMQVSYFGKNKQLSSLPKSKFVFKPMSEREQHEADERIEKIRKGDFTLAFVDSSGKPLTAAQIEINQVEHSFPFGSAISTLVFQRHISDREREQYFKYFEENFNKAVFENAMKWRDKNYKENGHTEKILSFLEEKNIPYRGHVLTWPSFKKSPAYLQTLKDKPVLLQQEILDHIKDFSGRWPKITDWDVLNEPFSNHDFMDCLPKGSASKWFEQARRYLPEDCKLCINDFGILNSYNTKHRDHYYNFTKNLIAEGAPLDSIGFQSHFKYAQEASLIKQRLDRFAALGKTLKITEFDLPAEDNDEDIQAQFLYDFLTLSFSHPSVNEFILWGFWDKRHWREKCGLYRADWSLRPQGKVWQELTQKKWRSHAKVKTNASGKVQGRFFFGTYSVTVTTQDGGVFEQEIKLLDDGSSSKVIKQN
ncbi:endo-1,4-beta-xylanase [Lentisphaera profundi]|uniref:Beta-xylanase n=1 Tax=Lentisphaera profundi TaxID=1658616 RepID=A0ABY7W0G1_9BACT|nr:endo-1,4-beta-xylanase [Lentisphaera profundi]WDE98469.1 endo-1,4-beta-xylanase [Lentisphaera profundi]